MKNLKFMGTLMMCTLLIASCEKFDFEQTLTTINGEEYYSTVLNREINKIIIEDGNGTIHVQNGSNAKIDVPGYWIYDEGFNKFKVQENTLIIWNTFADTYVTMSSLTSIEVIDENSTVLVETDLAEGSMDIEIGGNAQVIFGEARVQNEQGAAVNPVYPASGFNYNVEIYQNGTLEAYGIAANDVKANVYRNGTAYMQVENSLNVNILSNGTVYYKGYPTITSNIDFQGKLIDKN